MNNISQIIKSFLNILFVYYCNIAKIRYTSYGIPSIEIYQLIVERPNLQFRLWQDELPLPLINKYKNIKEVSSFHHKIIKTISC